MSVTAPDRFDVVFAALSDPTRRSIVRRLADGEATVLELAEPFPIRDRKSTRLNSSHSH